MQPNIIPLEAIQIAKPCRADWNNMTGDEQARFCGSCHKNVYDLSQMTREDAQNLIQEKEGNVCVRLYRRPDGTVITSDCPVGKREVMKPMWWTLAGFVALMASGAAVWSAPVDKKPTAPVQKTSLAEKARALPIVGAVINKISPPPMMTMGDVAAASPPILGRIAAPPTAATPTPEPTNAPLMGKPTMNHVTMGEPMPAPIVDATPQPEMGEPMPICAKPPQS